jgi:hypothetical protein
MIISLKKFVTKTIKETVKGIVSQDFEVCLLVPLDSSDIATPARTCFFFFKVDFVSNF